MKEITFIGNDFGTGGRVYKSTSIKAMFEFIQMFGFTPHLLDLEQTSENFQPLIFTLLK